MARMPMITYMTPRAMNPARASQSTYLLLPALRATYLASRVRRRAVGVTTVASLQTTAHCPCPIALNDTASGSVTKEWSLRPLGGSEGRSRDSTFARRDGGSDNADLKAAEAGSHGYPDSGGHRGERGNRPRHGPAVRRAR